MTDRESIPQIARRAAALCISVAMLAPQDSGAAEAARAVERPGQLRVGAAKVDITPSIDSIRPSADKNQMLPVTSIRDRIHVRAIYFENGTTCGALIGVEQGAMRGNEPAVQKAALAVGCPRENIIASATHTHSGGTFSAAANTPAENMPNEATVNAAIIKAVTEAKARLQPARVGYNTTTLHINVNRDLFAHGKWYQGPNLDGPSDKTLAVLGFIADDGTPIGVYMNYAAHPINYYLTGVLSADFPGDASTYIERRYDEKTVAIFSQGASGDQNALYETPFMQLAGARRGDVDRADDRIGRLEPWYEGSLQLNDNAASVAAMSRATPAEAATAYEKAKRFNDDLVRAYGVLMGEASLEALKSPDIHWQATPAIAGSSGNVTCPGRVRLDMSARQGVLPPYKDGDAVEIQVGDLRIGDIHLVSVNGEVYNEIATRLKRVSPASNTMMVTVASGPPGFFGYIYSNAASHHLTFQVIGSRLKPGCAEDAIVASGVSQIRALAAAAAPDLYDQAVASPERIERDVKRDAVDRPAEMLRLAGIEPGMRVADILAADGYYTELLSHVVGPTGHVLMLNNAAYDAWTDGHWQKRIANNRLPNVEHRTIDLNQMNLGTSTLDAVLLIKVYHDFYWIDPKGTWPKVNAASTLDQIARALKPGGILLVVDHSAKAGSGSSAATPLHRIEEDQARKDFESRGLELVRYSDVLRRPEDERELDAGAAPTDRFALVFRKK